MNPKTTQLGSIYKEILAHSQQILTCPPRAIMLTQMVLVGLEEFSRHDLHSPV